MSRARYVCVEGLEGLGKTTQVELLVNGLREMGYKVLKTKEPGVDLLPITMTLRKLMLDAQYEEALTPMARELISQTIRSIHTEKLIAPAMDEYDFIIQDRGILSGLTYGAACGNDVEWLIDMAKRVSNSESLYHIYSSVIVLEGDVRTGLMRAKGCKQEFAAGDAMEARGIEFMEKVAANMNELQHLFPTTTVNVDGLSIQQVQEKILQVLGIK
jgi:dTMP kinase